MLSKKSSTARDQLEMVTVDQLVPQAHLVRKLEAAIDFSFIHDRVKDLYSEVGRPSIDAALLIKLPFIQYIFGIRSIRQTIKVTRQTWLIAGFLNWDSMILFLTSPPSGRIINVGLKKAHFSKISSSKS